MKKISLLVLVAVSVFFVSCKKEAKCPYSELSITAPQAETDSIQRYLIANNITAAVRHQSGFFYIIGTPGTGAVHPDVCSDITFGYQLNSLAGTSYGGTTGAETVKLTLGQTIPGWQKAIPLITEGGTLTLFIPPSLAYGSQAYQQIPGNTYLKFSLNLVVVQ
jgi:FKBP-type peptidyl-prolyl cis-trans isomerase FkpA